MFWRDSKHLIPTSGIRARVKGSTLLGSMFLAGQVLEGRLLDGGQVGQVSVDLLALGNDRKLRK